MLVGETGGRFGEAAGLLVDGVDADARIARARTAVKCEQVKGTWTLVVEDVKTEAGKREWTLTRRAVAAIKGVV